MKSLLDLNADGCAHKRIVPINADWGRCEDCGDDSFPISASAAGYEPEGTTEAEIEVERCHAALDRLYRYLVFLEPTLNKEQLLLCPVETTKWRKSPEWNERYEYLRSPDGISAEKAQLESRIEAIKERFPRAHFPLQGISLKEKR